MQGALLSQNQHTCVLREVTSLGTQPATQSREGTSKAQGIPQCRSWECSGVTGVCTFLQYEIWGPAPGVLDHQGLGEREHQKAPYLRIKAGSGEGETAEPMA